MIEVLVAVVIMGLVATASLKLAALSSQALAAVRERELFLDRARALQTERMLNDTETSGISLDLNWRVVDKEAPMFDEETFGQLNFQGKSADKINIKWREVIIEGKKQSITLILPPKNQEN